LLKKKTKFFLIIFSILLCFFWSNYNLKNFDNIKINFDNEYYNQLLYADLENTWHIASEFKKQLDQGKNIIESIPPYERFFLPSLIVGFYYHVIDKDIYEIKQDNQKVIKVKNYKFGIIIFQILAYYSALLFFSNNLKKNVSKNQHIIIIFFLCYEPSTLQWHSTLWSESFFLSLQLTMMSLILKNSSKLSNVLIIGIILGILFCQRSVSFLYIVPVILYFLLFKKKIINQLILLLGFFLIIIPVGFNNFQKTGTYYLLPTFHQFYSYYHYFAHVIKADQLNITQTEAKNVLKKNEKKWREENNINLDKKEDYLKNIDYRNKIFLEETLKNPFYVIKTFIKKTLTMFIIHPFWVNEFFYYDKSDPEAKNDKKKYYHKNLLKNIFYSVFIYIFTLIGFLTFLRKIILTKKISNFQFFLFFNILSVLYFVSISGLWGNPKYLAPCMISIGLFFSEGLQFLVKKFKIYQQN
jgi:hypothetical protein